ncbi:MAG: hypothetical protein EAZ31_07525 [Cytophagia bacterium]|nr:MAG: hypothetical protein EAZ31_07525 [Cytophagia bacterium]
MIIDSQTIIEDLSKMALLLNTHQISTDTGALYKMQEEMRKLTDDDVLLWWYGSEEDTYDYIRFKPFTMSHTRPHEAEVIIHLVVKSKGKKVEIGINPFESLNIQIILCGYTIDGNDVKSAWHMDMDTSPQNNYIHPLFHINFGGRELEMLQDTGEILLLRSPRLMHPPMDIFLAIDFVVQNFYGRDESIFKDEEYQGIIQKYRKLCWYSYSVALASNFYSFKDKNICIDNTFAKNIWGN